MKRFVKILFVIIIPEILIFSIIGYWNSDYYEGAAHQKKLEVSKKEKEPADHSTFPELQKEFKTPQELTAACLSCHTNRGTEFMHTSHWNWVKEDSVPGKGKMSLGKKNLPNNFCIGVNTNEALCSKCHAGYGYKDKHFDFNDQNNIDCIVCHDNSGTYKKGKPGEKPKDGKKPAYHSGGGNPSYSVDLTKVAQSVGYPERSNCLSCHGVGGGGNNVKHGDLEMAQKNCTKDVDIHMAKDGLNMDCQECHKTSNHKIKGNLASVSSTPEDAASCTDCHTTHPHHSKVLNQHFEQIACQTCHIPTYAKQNKTKVFWDWSTAGEMENGEEIEWKKEIGKDSILEYGSKHGTAIFASNLTPSYAWSNSYYDKFLFTDSIKDTTQFVALNKPVGSYQDNLSPSDPENPSKIIPLKIMKGKQIFDKVNMTLIQPNTVGPKGSGAYWSDFDWNASAKKGMDYLGLPYSGEYSFINTQSYWPINHMVSSKEKALSCEECHNKNGRLQNLTGFYLPGRDANPFIDYGGIIFIISVILGVVIHGSLRIFIKK